MIVVAIYWFVLFIICNNINTISNLFDPSKISTRFDLLCSSEIDCMNSRGTCLLEKCICKPGYSGDHCDIIDHNIDIDNIIDITKQCIELVCYEHDSNMLCNPDPSDVCHYHPDYGVLEVSKSRWEQAQYFELQLWKDNDDIINDRSDEHINNFNNYHNLPNQLGHVLEIGAGPFTQLKSILDITNASFKSLTIVEPQILQYMTNVSGCTYKDKTINNHTVSFIIAPAEQIMMGEIFDTVIMINTIEHVQNAIAVLHNLYHSIKPGGLLILNEAAYHNYYGQPYKYHKLLLDYIFHPIKINYKFWNWYLYSHFDVLYHYNIDYTMKLDSNNNLIIDDSINNNDINNNKSNVEITQIYFIGRKPIIDIAWNEIL